MDQSAVAKVSKALSDPTRLSIYQAIASRAEMFCGELVEKHGLNPATVSHHLKILSDAGLIECRREGQFVYNRARPETIRDYTAALDQLAAPKRRA